MTVFANRAAAGRELAGRLTAYRQQPKTIVLGLPRGGVPVAYEVAHALALPLDVLVVRKLGAPGQKEFALGALASGDVVVFNENVPDWAYDDDDLNTEMAAQRIELQRRELAYRGDRPPLEVRNWNVILVDDGAATGSTMRAAVGACRKLGAGRVIVALPVASQEAHANLSEQADQVVCIQTPIDFRAVGDWYDNFNQTTDSEVRDSMSRNLKER